MIKLHRLHQLNCDFCGTSFKDTSTLNRHIKTNKKCLSKRPETKIHCVWCKEEFLSKIYLEKHNCSVNKESVYLSLTEKYNELEKQFKSILEEKDNQIKAITEEKDKQIKDLQDKIFSIAKDPKTTNVQNNTYNVTLQCGKPMTFSISKMVKLLRKTCNINYVLQGEIGLGKWFLDHGCRNDKGEICVQSTDKNRGIIKYIDESGVVQRVERDAFIGFFKNTLIKYVSTSEYEKISNEIIKLWEKYHGNETLMGKAFISPKNKFFRYVLKETHKGKLEFINSDSSIIESDYESDEDDE